MAAKTSITFVIRLRLLGGLGSGSAMNKDATAPAAISRVKVLPRIATTALAVTP